MTIITTRRALGFKLETAEDLLTQFGGRGLPGSGRRNLIDVSDEVATKVSFVFHSNAKDGPDQALDE